MTENHFKSLRGTRDIFSTEGKAFEEISQKIKNIFFKFNFEFLETPIIENYYVFERATGEESDAVSKEIYKFEDKSNNIIALRPEFTAGIVRFLLENNLNEGPFPRRFISSGPLFRYDRPQKGRYRQFYQINCETFGSSNSLFEIIFQLKTIALILENLDIKFTLKINHLGTKQAKDNYILALVNFLKEHKDNLSSDSQNRLDKNPLRILDSKDKKDIEILQNCPLIKDFYLDSEYNFLEKIQKSLQEANFNVEIDGKLVRGLDYYSGFIFEFISKEENYAICGGGEYNNLISNIQSQTKENKNITEKTNAFGFAFGLDRLVLEFLKKQHQQQQEDELKIIFVYDEALKNVEDFKFFNIFMEEILNKNSDENKSKIKDIFITHFNTSIDDKKIKIEHFQINNLKKGIEKALKMNADYLVIKCEKEIAENKIIIKDLKEKRQVEIID